VNVDFTPPAWPVAEGQHVFFRWRLARRASSSLMRCQSHGGTVIVRDALNRTTSITVAGRRR
jgi:hypothetical protein